MVATARERLDVGRRVVSPAHRAPRVTEQPIDLLARDAVRFEPRREARSRRPELERLTRERRGRLRGSEVLAEKLRGERGHGSPFGSGKIGSSSLYVQWARHQARIVTSSSTRWCGQRPAKPGFRFGAVS
jgi:hypothetical protein